MADRNHVRHVKVGVNDFLSRGHSHDGVIESSAEINVVAADTFEPDEGIVPGHVRIIAVGILEIGWKRRTADDEIMVQSPRLQSRNG